jgi:hypothetical protein
MKEKWHYLVAILAVAFISGVSDGWCAAVGWDQGMLFTFVPLTINLFFLFGWLRIDGQEIEYKRSDLMNIGIVLITPIIFPVYLAKSRPTGQRAKAIACFALFLVGWFVATFTGFLPGYWLAP